MNPSYKGRQQLPDNLKALFRTVAMMVPDYKLIAEILLYSFGFSESTILSGKMVDTFRLCSEQLSKQTHYDYGMRAVKSTINAAGYLKRIYPNSDEYSIVLKALVDINLPKFLSNDTPLFNNIISDIFPTTHKQKTELGPLEKAIRDAMTELNLKQDNNFIDKIYQLYDTMTVRHGLMIIGPTGSGKTSNYMSLFNGLNKLAPKFDMPEEELEEYP